MWKDVLFSAFVLLYVLTVFQMLKKSTSMSFFGDWKLLLGCFLSGWAVCMMRSNGLYIFLFTLPFLLIAFRKQLKRKLLLGCFLSGWAVCMMRSNGLYIFLFTLPFLLIAFRKQLKLMLPLQLSILILAVLAKGPVSDAFGVEHPSFTESLSIPLQQVARVVAEGRPLTQEQETLIDRVVTDSSLIPDYYNPLLQPFHFRPGQGAGNL